MSQYFAHRFLSVEKNKNPAAREILFLFEGLHKFSSADLATTIERQLESTWLPDDIVIVAPLQQLDLMVDEFEKDKILRIAVERGSTIRTVSLAGYGGKGVIEDVIFLRKPQHSPDFDTEFMKEWLPNNFVNVLLSGISKLAEKNSVIKIVPPGCFFRKPSERYANYFLRGEDLGHTEAEMAFVALCMLQMTAGVASEIGSIYVDTLGIYPIASVYSELIRTVGLRNHRPIIESFNSYWGAAKIEAAESDQILVLISASTSGGLADQVHRQTGCDSHRIVTLIDTTDKREKSNILFNISKLLPKNAVADASSPPPGTALIQISGEFFSNHAAKPREVSLRLNHELKELRRFWRGVSDSQLFTCHTAIESATTIRPLAAAGEYLLAIDCFQDWWQSQIRRHLLISTKMFVHQDDIASEKLALEIYKYATEVLNFKFFPKPINQKTLKTADKLDKDSSVLIIAAACGRGSKLLSISRELRHTAPTSNCTYLVGLCVCKYQADIKKLKSNLEKSPSTQIFKIEIFESLAIGYEEGASPWEMELQFLTELEDKRPLTDISIILAERKNTLCATSKPFSDPFLPALNGTGLKLREGFVFWNKGYKTAQPGNVAATIACILQNSRENTLLSDGDKLASSIIQHVVISPDSFTRFNDGIIQAAILRAAYPSELDYSCSPDFSGRMADIICEIIDSSERDRGEAVLEFSLAIGLKRLKLTEKDFTRVFVAAENHGTHSNIISALIARIHQ